MHFYICSLKRLYYSEEYPLYDINSNFSVLIFAHSEGDQKAFLDIAPILPPAYLQDHTVFG